MDSKKGLMGFEEIQRDLNGFKEGFKCSKKDLNGFKEGFKEGFKWIQRNGLKWVQVVQKRVIIVVLFSKNIFLKYSFF